MFFHFWRKFENSKWPPFLGRGKFFENQQYYIPLIPCGSKISTKIALSRTVKEIEAILCFSIFGENSKIQNGRHFWGGENFLKINYTTFLLYPVGRKFRRNRSISHRFWDKRVFVFSALRKIVTFSKSLISRPFCIGSFRKVIDFQTCI